jgi:hypothetical protein
MMPDLQRFGERRSGQGQALPLQIIIMVRENFWMDGEKWLR